MSKTDTNRAQLNELIDRLPPDKVEQVLEFTRFLFERYGAGPERMQPPVITAPADETVVDAIKRMHAAYPMLDVAVLLPQCAELMTQHIMGERERTQIIADVESLFITKYQELTCG